MTQPREQVAALILQKESIESELQTHISVLKANNCTLSTPLVDKDGFPRADLDIYAVRGARVRIIELRNDLKDVMNAIGKALEGVYDPALAPPEPDVKATPDIPFAKVNGVSPASPCADAVCSSIRLCSCP